MTLFEKVTLNHLDISFHLGWPIFRYPYRPDFFPAGDQHTSLPVGHGPSMGRNGPGVLRVAKVEGKQVLGCRVWTEFRMDQMVIW